MIKTMMILMTITFIYLSSISNNPLKTSLMILLFSSVSFLSAKIMAGMTWFPLIFYMLFTGGILMIFMILSSIMPNEKVKKSKSAKFWIILIVLFGYATTMAYPTTKENMGEIKSMIGTTGMFFLMSGTILMYFFYSMSLNEKETTPMRSI